MGEKGDKRSEGGTEEREREAGSVYVFGEQLVKCREAAEEPNEDLLYSWGMFISSLLYLPVHSFSHTLTSILILLHHLVLPAARP